MYTYRFVYCSVEASSVEDALMPPPSVEEIDVDFSLSPSLPKIITLWSASHRMLAIAGKNILIEGGNFLGRRGTSYYGNRLVGMCHWMASHFHDWNAYAFMIETVSCQLLKFHARGGWNKI